MPECSSRSWEIGIPNFILADRTRQWFENQNANFCYRDSDRPKNNPLSIRRHAGEDASNAGDPARETVLRVRETRWSSSKRSRVHRMMMGEFSERTGIFCNRVGCTGRGLMSRWMTVNEPVANRKWWGTKSGELFTFQRKKEQEEVPI